MIGFILPAIIGGESRILLFGMFFMIFIVIKDFSFIASEDKKLRVIIEELKK